MSRSSKPNFVTKKSLKPLAREKPPAREKRSPALLHVPSETTEDRILSRSEVHCLGHLLQLAGSREGRPQPHRLADDSHVAALRPVHAHPPRRRHRPILRRSHCRARPPREGGYIRREPNPADRRSLLIHINPARLLKLKGIYENVEAETRRSLSTLPKGDLAAVIRFFEALSSVRSNRTP